VKVTVAAAVLAAGDGSRFTGGSHKLLAQLHGEPIVVSCVMAALGAGFNQVYVVTGAVDLGHVLPEGVTVVESPRWTEGQSLSLQAVVKRAEADGHRAIVVGLGDQPLVPASAWRSVGAAKGQIVVASFDGQRRPPVKLESEVWHLLPTEGDLGARHLIRDRPDLVSEIPCTGNPADIDTAEDLALWNSRTTS